jgi:hypothetical protein
MRLVGNHNFLFIIAIELLQRIVSGKKFLEQFSVKLRILSEIVIIMYSIVMLWEYLGTMFLFFKI